ARVLAPLLACGTPIGEMVRPVPYRSLQTLLDLSASPGMASHWRSHRIGELSDAAIDAIVGLAGSLPTPMSLLNGWVIGGAAGRVAPAATAVGPRGPGFELRVIANWRPGDPAGDAHAAWVRQ